MMSWQGFPRGLWGRRALLNRRLYAALLALVAATAWADHSAPAPRLGGVALCTDGGSVRAEVVGAGETQGAAVARLEAQALQRLREHLTRSAVSYRHAEACRGEGGYVVLDLYARYLDPETYLGFPEDSYTYVVSTQVGRYTSPLASDTTLAEGVYVAATSDILQAEGAAELQAQLLSLTDAQGQLLTQTWQEANLVPTQRLALFGALALVLALTRGVAWWTAARR